MGTVAWLENPDPEKYPGALPPLKLYAASAHDIAGTIECQAPECDGGIRRLWWLDPNELIFERYENYGRRAFYGWTPETGAIRRIYATNDWISDCSVAEERAVCFLESPTRPRRIVSLDLRTGDVSTLVDPNPEFKGIRLSDVEHMVWENEFGRRTWGYLVKPLDYDPGRRYPLIVVQYSPDSCLRGGVGDEFPTHAFAANGFAVLCFSQTGVDRDIFKTLVDPLAILRAEYEDFAKHKQSVSSLEVIIDALAQRGLVDPRRVGLTGLSAGVEVLQYALIHSKVFAAAATSGGGVEPISYFGSTASSRENFFHPLDFGNLYVEGEGGNWPEFSLALNAENIDVPLLIQAADREYLHSIQTVITWIVAGNAIEMRVFPDEHHVKWHPAHRFHVYERNVDWFNYWLRGVEDSSPEKSDQYQRWRAMREKQCARLKGDYEPWYCEKGEVGYEG
jgi:dipeptidyl aminopeptidase/acylaminoacyl peptidase